MIMGELRSCYDTTMQLWGPDGPHIPVRWFFIEHDSEVFPHPHQFGPVEWEQKDGRREGVGLLGPRGAYHNGKAVFTYPGDNFHGRIEAFRDGGAYDLDLPLLTDEDGVLDECRVELINEDIAEGDHVMPLPFSMAYRTEFTVPVETGFGVQLSYGWTATGSGIEEEDMEL